MKILEVCEFSAGICGVWTRVRQEASLLVRKKHNVFVFSSNIVKGTNQIAKSYEELEGIKIYRFPTKKSRLSENVTSFDFEKEFLELNPDIVITHTIHPHSFKALKLCKKYKKKCFLVTHAPFNIKRKFPLNIITKLYYSLKVSNKIKSFDKIIAITKWELPYIYKLGVRKEKIVYIPNGVPGEFFKQKVKSFSSKKIIFLGRIAPVKNIECLINAFNLLNKNIHLEIVGPIEEGYEEIKKYQSNKVKFIDPIYELNKKISKLQEADIFVLPSFREAMPQALIEAMSLGKIVISSSTDGAKEIINDNENGFLFEIGNSKELAEKIEFCLNKKNLKKIKEIQKNSRKTSEKFKWSNIIENLNSLF